MQVGLVGGSARGRECPPSLLPLPCTARTASPRCPRAAGAPALPACTPPPPVPPEKPRHPGALPACLPSLSGATGDALGYASGAKSTTSRSQLVSATNAENVAYDVGRK